MTHAAAPEAERLDFRLPEFTRFTWVDDRARAHWEPRIEQLKAAWSQVELASVRAGARRAAIRVVHPSELTNADGALHGLDVQLLGAVAMSSDLYMSAAASPEPGQPYALQVAVGDAGAAREVAEGWQAGDQDAIGHALGYPKCCTSFFRRVWVEEGAIDTTWAMAQATNRKDPAKPAAELAVAGMPEANILLRWMGVRAVPHLPCRFDCEETVSFGKATADVFRSEGLDAELELLMELLEWPVEWSALHGIMEVKTPVVRITANTDATAGPLRVRRAGTTWPKHGARGLAFPYQPPRALQRREALYETLP